MNPFTVAEETLGQSSMQRNLPGMVSKVQPGPNMFDAGASSKPGVNSQISNNERLSLQETSRNIESAGPQANVAAARDVNKRVQQDSDAQSRLNRRIGEIVMANIEMQGGSSALMRLGTQNNIERDATMANIASGKAMAMGLNPELGAEAAQKARYVG